MKIERILVTTDFSACARAAYRPAVEIARRHGALLELVHTLELPNLYPTFEYAGMETALKNHVAEIEALLEKERRREELGGLEPETHLLTGYGPRSVCDLASRRDADLLVQSSHGYTGVRHFLLGSFAERVLELATIPVLTVKTRDPAAPRGPAGDEGFRARRILFPYDLSPHSLSVVETVRFLAQNDGGEVLLAHVIKQLPDYPALFGPELSFEVSDRLKELSDRYFAEIEHRCLVDTGDPASRITEWARTEEVDVICMATHGWTGVPHVVLGSVAQRVTQAATCPVLTLRPGADTVEPDAAASGAD